VMIITFVLVGKYLEVLGKKHAVDTLDLLTSSIPTEVTVIKNGQKNLTALENVQAGDIIEVKAGEKIVIDGIIKEGSASFDESSLTGESLPILKQVGSNILSGSICLDSTIRYEATKDSSSSLLHSIVTLLEDSITKKPRIEQLANSISGYFSVIILLIASATFFGWYYIGSIGFERSLIISISVIVIACPCALGLATPMSTLMGISLAAKRGILFKEASYLETMAKCDIATLDKTGTLTEGKPKVIEANFLKEFDISLLYSLVSNSNHPISKGIKDYIVQNFENFKELKLESINSIQAKGISAIYDKQKIIGGNNALMAENGITAKNITENLVFNFAVNDELAAAFELKDTPKEGAKEMIESLKSLGLKVVMLTGDHEKSAKNIAAELGIDDIKWGLLPAGKAEVIDDLHKQNKKVIMVGDGINDSIALAKSDIAIA
ncbi:MAG: heavy metal translocating P-type ATPase, partial [Campylobacterales bacterium]|nr:heavy metal translocating P-type ATPase [Campylobacterales bacterium]